jgi:cytochrome P450
MNVSGPRGVPLLGNALAFRADRLAFLTALARDHGDVASFRIGPYRVWQLVHPEHVRDVLVTHADRFRKGPVLQRARLVLGDGLLTAEGDRHRRDRRLLQPAFHPRRLAGYAETMVQRAERTSRRWRADIPVDLHAETVRITLASAGATLLGTEVEDDIDLVEAAIADLLSAYALAFVPFGWRLQRIPVGPMRRLQRGRASLRQLVDRMIADRSREGRDGGDLLSALVVGDAGAELTADEVRDQAITLLLAGHETTANALAFAFHLLAVHPEVEEQVHAEIDAVVGDRLPTADDVAALPSCRALFAESLRLYPPSWAMGRQVVADHTVGGHVVPSGELVLLPQWVVHRDPRWWPEPERCRLERWTVGADPRPRGAYFPFGAGVRQCIGEGFAWTEGTLAIATIARRWRLRPLPGRPVELDPLITLRPRSGVWMRPTPRSAGT